MKKIILLLCSFFYLISLYAQPVNNLLGKIPNGEAIFEILPDNGYTIQQILIDSSLSFSINDSIKPNKQNTYWIKLKINNPSQYATEYQLWVHPQIHNTLYYYNANTQQWDSINAGLQVPANKRLTGNMPCILQADTINTFYVKVQVQALQKFATTFKPSIYLYKTKPLEKHESYVTIIWISTILIIFAFLLYHLYLFIYFRDKIYLNYITIQLGAIFYITGFGQFFNQLITFKLVNFKLLPNRNLYFYDLNNFLTHFAIIIIIIGFVQLTRAYLNTKSQLPKLDKLLVIALLIYITQAILNSVTTITGLFYLDYYTTSYDNIFILVLIGMIFFTAIKAWKKGIIGAKYFLFANTIPLSLMIILAAYFAIFKFQSSSIQLLPNIAVVSQAIAFAIAIVWKISLIKEELSATQTKMNTLHNQYEQLNQRNQYIELENKYIADEMALHINQKEALQAKLDANQRELASNTLYILQKNELMIGLQKQISQLAQQQATNVQKQVFKEMKSTLQNSVQLDNDWDKFKLHFEQVHPNFFTELEQKYPNLTPYEIRLSAYLHLQMTAKEIAALLNIDASSVHRAKTRLKKKLENTG